MLLIHLHIWMLQASKDVRWMIEWLISHNYFSVNLDISNKLSLDDPIGSVLLYKSSGTFLSQCIQRIITQPSVSWIRIVLHRFSPDELLNIFFSKWWLLKIKAERPWANRLLVDIMKRCQVWVAQCLINCKQPGIEVIFSWNNGGK